MTKKVELRVYGMTCDDCVAHVSEGLKGTKGVLDVIVSLKDGKAEVLINDAVNPKELENIEVFKKPSHYKAQVRRVKDE
ncbi:MAG: cation transporter [Candidatus Thermoplasmatota archaeon]|jgi:copper chaperone CopZ|nr:cation transporter [Candidatus Thermoplasmatota archaeon]MCL5963085.1 cation transporter [Candidatus Thermoplasmatota archaeon]